MLSQSILRKRLFELPARVMPVIGASGILALAWFIVLSPIGMMFGPVALIVVPFLTLYSLLLLLSLLGMDVSEDAESKADLDHLLSMKRTTGFPIRPRRGAKRRFARPPADLLDDLFHR